MANVKLPYIVWRDGRPQFKPNPGLRKLGFVGEDLKIDGRWLNLEETETWALVRLEAIKATRASGRPIIRSASSPALRNTVAHLVADWLVALELRAADPSDTFSPDSLRSYRGSAAALIWKPETRGQAKARRERERAAKLLGAELPTREAELFGQTPVLAIDDVHLNTFYKYLRKVRGPYMAKAAVNAFSAAWTWGRLDDRWRLGKGGRSNPRFELTLPQGKGRIVVWNDAELRTMIATADAAGRQSIGDSIVLGIFTAQRQRDRLELEDRGLLDGRRQFLQSKTDVLVPIKEAPELADRLAAARLRVRELGLKYRTRPATVVVDETTGKPYVQDTYRRVFGEIRAAAAERMPSIASKRDADLRDTAVTWMARAGNSLLNICMVSGHSPGSVQTIIRHYLGAAPELGDAAIDNLVAWMTREEMTLTG